MLLLGQAPGRARAPSATLRVDRRAHALPLVQGVVGIDKETFRARVYMAAVARCFPGKAKGGGDRRPDGEEIAACRTWLAREVALCGRSSSSPWAALAIEQVLGEKAPLRRRGGDTRRTQWHERDVDVIALPHPSGASTWHKLEPGKTLLAKALRLVARHPAMRGLG